MAISRTQLLMYGVGDPGLCHRLTRRSVVVGDPGVLNILRKIGGTALGFVPGGGIASTVARTVGGALAKRTAGQTTVAGRIGALLPSTLTPQRARRAGLGLAGGALTAAGLISGARVVAPILGRLAGGALGMGGAAGRAPGGRRRRSMKVANVKALRRATRRLAGFHHLAISTERALSHLVRHRTRKVFSKRKA